MKNEDLKGYIPRARFNEVNDKKKDLEQQIKDRDKQLKDLEEKVKGYEDTEKIIKELQEANKKIKADYEGMIRDMTIHTAILVKLAGTLYPDLLIPKFDKSKIVIGQDGIVSGIDNQIKIIKEQYKELFTPTVAGWIPRQLVLEKKLSE